MADVFISYAREDREFARRLVEDLKQRGHESWIDWEGIEPSDRWWESVTEAMDASDAVVFITSPDSLASEVCRREIRHAAGQHKRLIPVVCRDIEGLDMPEEISELNWVFLRPEDEWAGGTVKLERALELDIVLVRVHTRVLTRAEAWRLSGRRPSPLLRGEELRAAEQWVARAAAGGEPQPTELQSEFILASRRLAARRQRQAIGVSLGVAAIAIGLSIFAFIQRAQARHEARLAQSRELAATAEAELTTSPGDAIAVAARALRVAPTLQAEHALWSALQASRLRGDFVGPSPVDTVAFSPDGRELVTGSDDGGVRLWGLAGRRLKWSTPGHGPAGEVAFANRGDVLLVQRGSLSSACTIQVLSAATGATERTIGPFTSTCFFALLGHSRTVEIGTGAGTVQPWNIDTGAPIGPGRHILPATAVPFGLAASPDGQKLALVAVHQVIVLSASTLRPVTTIAPSTIAFNPGAVAFSPDGSELMISGEYATEIYYFASGGATDLYAQDGSTVGAAWSPDARVVAAGAGFVGVDVWSNSTRLVEVLHGGGSQGFDSVAFSPTDLLAAGSRDGSVRVWASDPDLPDASSPYPASLSITQGYGAPRAHLAVFGDARSGVLVVNDAGRPLAHVTPHGDGPLAVTQNGELAFTRDGHLDLMPLRGNRRERTWTLPAGTPAAVAVSADGTTTATLATNGTITRVSPQRMLTTRVSLTSTPVVAPTLSMSPDGRLLAVTTRSGIEILDTRNLRAVRHEPGVAVSFSPSGRLIAIQRPGLSIDVESTGSWRMQATLTGEPSIAGRLSFSPDDRLLAAIGSQDGALQVWDTSDGTEVATRQIVDSSLDAQRTTPLPVVLTAAGDALVPAFGSSALNVYDVCHDCFDPGALLAQADARVRQIAPVIGGR